jgi:hypothetical protein
MEFSMSNYISPRGCPAFGEIEAGLAGFGDSPFAEKAAVIFKT